MLYKSHVYSEPYNGIGNQGETVWASDYGKKMEVFEMMLQRDI